MLGSRSASHCECRTERGNFSAKSAEFNVVHSQCEYPIPLEHSFTSNLPKVAVPLCLLFVVARVILDLPFGSEINRFLITRIATISNVIHPKMADF